MKILRPFVMALITLAYSAGPAWSQGKGQGAGAGSRSPSSMPTARGGEGKAFSGRETGSRITGHPHADGPRGIQTGAAKTPGQLLAQNTHLSSRLQPHLPAGTKVQDAAHGFKNLGQFVAAVHVSKNLNIPFDSLKAEMMEGKSLGQAIQQLKPGVDAPQEALKADEQARRDIHEARRLHKSAAQTSGPPK